MPLRFLPLPFLHVCFACSVNCFLLLPFATRVPLFFGPLFLVGRSEHRPCLFIFFGVFLFLLLPICFGTAYFLRHVGVVLLFWRRLPPLCRLPRLHR